jgi:hypothetical protein
LEDASGAGIGEIEETVYDAVSDVLKYAVVEDLPLPSKTPPASSTGGCVLTTRSPARADSKGALGGPRASRFVPRSSKAPGVSAPLLFRAVVCQAFQVASVFSVPPWEAVWGCTERLRR